MSLPFGKADRNASALRSRFPLPVVSVAGDDITFAIVVLPGTATRVGWNRLWRLRQDATHLTLNHGA